MLSLFTRRVALSAYRSSATYSRFLSSSALVLRDRGIPHNIHHTATVRTFTHPQRDASTKATAKTKKASPPTKSKTTDGTQPGKRLSKHEKELALIAKKKAKAKKEKEAVALQRQRLAERRKKVAEAKANEKKAKEAEKKKLIKPPPRRMNSFALYMQEAKKNPKEAVADWHNLSEEAKQEYAVRAKAVTVKLKEEFDAFAKTVTHEDVIRYNRFRRSKGRYGIRVKFGSSSSRPMASFMRYMQEFRTRPDQSGKLPREIAKVAGEAWHSLSQEEKDRYKHHEHKPTEPTTA